ncbi:MAG: DUF3488 and DUF4129 domain-containing transglutaminase family protein [Gemmataceae bacterium]
MHDRRAIRFFRSFYANLAIAGACLICGDWAFLPEMPLVVLITGVLFVTAYWLEGRWEMPATWANLLGLGIFLLLGGWVLYQVYRPWPSPIDNLPWPTSLLPYLGPPVLILIAAKLLRPKHLGDYWGLLGIGIIAVALACSLVGEAFFGLFLLAYSISLIIALERLQQMYWPAEITNRRGVFSGQRALTWTTLIALVAVGAFLLTPRLSDAQWEIGQIGGKLQTGLPDRGNAIDLNLGGSISVNREVAFEVRALDEQKRPKLDIAPFQRWRAATFSSYTNGRWGNYVFPPRGDNARFGKTMERGNKRPTAPATPPKQLPDLGPHEFFVTFKIPTKPNQNIILADPVWRGVPFPGDEGQLPLALVFSGGQLWPGIGVAPTLNVNLPWAPIASIADNGSMFPWAMTPDGDIYSAPLPANQKHPRIQQVVAPNRIADISPVLNIHPLLLEYLKASSDLPGLKNYTAAIVTRMIKSGTLDWDGNPAQDPLPERYHEKVARALCRHLSMSQTFQYSLNLTRKDKTIDPVEDFVLNVRAGHCNRFSSALALMLRCQGIPSRVVMGFCGAEHVGDGVYVVRQSDAHSWVEAPIRRIENGHETWNWLTLDPTPESERTAQLESSQFGRWIDDVQRGTSDLFKSFVIEYNTDRQQSAAQFFGSLNPMEWIAKIPTEDWPGTILCLIVLVFMFLVASVAIRRPARAKTGETRFHRFLALARQRRLVSRRTSLTPREAIQEFTAAMNGREQAPKLVLAARRLADDYCAVRFGGQQAVNGDSDFRTLMAALRNEPRRPVAVHS